MYHGASGRFCTRDPIQFSSGQANFYELARANPLAFADPFGYSKVRINNRFREPSLKYVADIEFEVEYICNKGRITTKAGVQQEFNVLWRPQSLSWWFHGHYHDLRDLSTTSCDSMVCDTKDPNYVGGMGTRCDINIVLQWDFVEWRGWNVGVKGISFDNNLNLWLKRTPLVTITKTETVECCPRPCWLWTDSADPFDQDVDRKPAFNDPHYPPYMPSW
jgi:hypothetical protein